MPLAHVNDADLYFEIRGTGPELLFINGIGADLSNPVGAFTSPLPEHFTVLAYDPRGFGRSSGAAPVRTIAAMADDAAGLAAAAGWRRYHVFGASMGGMVAQELALRHPDAVDRLVLGVTNPGGAYAGHVGAHEIRGLDTAAMLQAADTRQDDAWMRANPDTVRQAEQRFRATWDALEADPSALAAYQAQVDAARAHDTSDRLGAIAIPTLVFGGRYDGSCSPEVTGALAGRIPGARFELFEAGHGNWFADTHAWTVILEFLGANVAAPGTASAA